MSNHKTPSIRFKGFTDDWEQRKLGDVVSVYDGVHQTPDYKDNGIMFLSVENIATLRSEKYISEEAFKRDYKIYPQKGDILMTRIGDVGTPNVVETSEKVAFYVSLALLKPSCIDSYFLCNAIQSPLFQKGLKDRTVVTAIPQKINKDEIGKVDLILPVSTEEQTAIGEYFKNLDHLITLHQRKYEKLVNVKKSMLDKMFPKNDFKVPEIRFKGFTDDWEQRKLGDVATFINGRAYSQPELLSSGKYKVLRVGNFYTNDSWYYSDLELGEKYYADYGDLLYTWSATFGPHIWLGDRVIYHYHIWKIDLSNQLEKQFAVQLLEQDKANILSSKNGSTMVHITKEGMEQKDVIIPPSTKEQQEIGAFFQQLDNLITLHQREHFLFKLKQIKNA